MKKNQNMLDGANKAKEGRKDTSKINNCLGHY
jgi:hypothetical protein